MTREQTKQAVITHLGSYEAMRAYVEANAVELSTKRPQNATEVLGDYGSSINVVGFEDGYFWDTDTSERLRYAPRKWAPIPELPEEA